MNTTCGGLAAGATGPALAVTPASALECRDRVGDGMTGARDDGWAHRVVWWQFDTRRDVSVVIPDRHTATKPGRAGTAGPWSRCLSVSL